VTDAWNAGDGPAFAAAFTDEVDFVVVQTLSDGESRLSQAGRYFDRVVRTGNTRCYQRKRAVYDTSRVQTLLVTPV
jgi:anthranilate 1,2-dioxygenase small subunit